jgi:hypothetical protein
MMVHGVHELRSGAQVLGLQALHFAAHGKTKDALNNVACMYRIAQHIDDPLLITMVNAIGVEIAAAKTLEGILSLSDPKAEELAALTVDDAVSYRRQFHRACQMEESALGLGCYTLLDSPNMTGEWFRKSMEPFGMAVVSSPVYRVFFLQSDLAGYRRFMQEAQQLAQRPYYETAPNWQARDRALRGKLPGIIAALIIPATERVAAVAADGDAYRQLSRLALAAAAHRAKHGEFPAKLDELVPAYLPTSPRDPFDGWPLRLQRAGKNLVVYSIGRDLRDDGGAAMDPARHEGDVVLRLGGK